MQLIKDKNSLKLLLDGREVGHISWNVESNIIYVMHTYVDPMYRGNDYAIILVDGVCEYARSEGKKIIPVCPYVVKVMNRYEKYSDVLEKSS